MFRDTKLLQQLRQNPASFAQGHEILDSIVKVFTVHSRPNHFLPWQNHPKRESTGTGFVIHDRLILTNAHCIADATYVTVKRHGSGTRYRAHVQAVGHDCDLSLLSVEDDGFWDAPTSIKPLALGPVPALQQLLMRMQDVRVLGYPTGGDNTSVTSGVVSRVEVAQYVHSASHLMAIQIDAAINPGNSGGPAMQGDEVVGVAFQNLPNADNIGYIIPTPVVSHFLSEVARYGQYRGYCSLGLMCQNLENPHLRKALAMPPGATGVLVNSVQQTSTACKFISKGDVLLEFNGVPIANDGTVHLRQRERIYFSWLITLLPTGQTARVKLLREGKVREIEVVMQPNDMLVPVHSYDKLPTYFIYAAMHTLMKQPSQQIVTLSQVLVDDVNTGYQQLQNLQVVRVNGVEVLNLAHLQQLVATPAKDGFVRFELEDDRLIAVDAVLAESAASRIADRYRVPRLASGDLATETAA
ncbi:trypsin family [Haematococcus lacustris]|uniref:Trypsin family n=1 Tax=Haematococcus lacustris TaxID=44745 RepID=A0A699Y9M7_HAELA|nr:trypsin family [Haematococcus lacustris]